MILYIYIKEAMNLSRKVGVSRLVGDTWESFEGREEEGGKWCDYILIKIKLKIHLSIWNTLKVAVVCYGSVDCWTLAFSCSAWFGLCSEGQVLAGWEWPLDSIFLIILKDAFLWALMNQGHWRWILSLWLSQIISFVSSGDCINFNA